MRLNLNKILNSFLTIISVAYLSGVCMWLILRFLFHDSWWWLFFLNALSLYIFAFIPVIFICLLFLRNKILTVLLVLLFLVPMFLFGELFIPKKASISAYNISVMTYNLNFNTNHNSKIIFSIHASEADVIALQELNVTTAELIKIELIKKYPFQILNPANDVSGMGIISRLPIKQSNDDLPGVWLGRPQIIDLELNGELIKIINIHSTSIVLDSFSTIKEGVISREEQAHFLIDYIQKYNYPTIIMGDFNLTDQNHAYKILTNKLTDAWRRKGFGFGHTFPGGAGRYKIYGKYIPQWLFRIDYIFYTSRFNIKKIYLGEWDGISDHRPIVAKLLLK